MSKKRTFDGLYCKNGNQTFYCSRCTVTLTKRVTSLRGPFPRHGARAKRLMQRNITGTASRWQNSDLYGRLKI